MVAKPLFDMYLVITQFTPPPPSRSLKLRPFHNICHIFPYRACLTELRKRAASAEKRRRGIPPVFWTLPTTELTMVQFWGRTSLPSGLCMCITHRTTTACLLVNYSAVQKISLRKSTKPCFFLRKCIQFFYIYIKQIYNF